MTRALKCSGTFVKEQFNGWVLQKGQCERAHFLFFFF